MAWALAGAPPASVMVPASDRAVVGAPGLDNGRAAVDDAVTPAPDQGEHDEPDRAGDHQDDADGVDVEAFGRVGLDGKGEDRPHRKQEDAGSGSHGVPPDRADVRCLGCFATYPTAHRGQTP